jgi:hypothetical protein
MQAAYDIMAALLIQQCWKVASLFVTFIFKWAGLLGNWVSRKEQHRRRGRYIVGRGGQGWWSKGEQGRSRKVRRGGAWKEAGVVPHPPHLYSPMLIYLHSFLDHNIMTTAYANSMNSVARQRRTEMFAAIAIV